MSSQSGIVVSVDEARKLAIVEHADGKYAVLGWTQGCPFSIDEALRGDMGAGGWARLANETRGADFHAYRHLNGCSRSDAFTYVLP